MIRIRFVARHLHRVSKTLRIVLS